MKNISSQNDFYKNLFSLVLPAAFSQFMLSLVSVSDAVMLGSLNQNAMSAVSLAGQVSFVHSLFIAALVIGLGMFAAQYWGKRDSGSVSRIFSFVLRLSLFVSVLFFLLNFLFPSQIMKAFSDDETLIQNGAEYLRAVSLSFFLTGISEIYLCVLKNSGRVLKASVISSCAVLLNVVFNGILIFGLFGFPALGIRGAAVATVLAKAVQVVWCLAESARQNSVRPVRGGTAFLKSFSPVFWKYTLPVLGNELVWGVGVSVYAVITGRLGQDAAAASSLVNAGKNLVISFCMGLSVGGGIITGNLLGANLLEEAKRAGQKLLFLSVAFGILSGLLLVLLTPVILKSASLTSEASRYARIMILISSYYLAGKSINCMTVGGIFPAGGDSKFGFVCDTVTLWCFAVPAGILAAFVFKAPVLFVYFILNLDEIVKLPVVFKRYFSYKWLKNLTDEVQSEKQEE